MALSPFTTSQSPLNRSRSSSCSSPVRNRIVYQEVYSIGPNTLVRSCSCDQVFDKDDSGRTFQRTQIRVSSFITPEKNFHVNPSEVKKKSARRLLAQLPATEKIKSKQQTNTYQSTLKKMMLFTVLAVTSSCALYAYLSYLECSYVWDLKRTELELKENIFGQDQAVQRIKSVLKTSNSSNDLHIMVFTGSVGVGKTYSSSIIRRNFPWSSSKLIAYSEYFAKDVENLKNQKLSKCGCNLVIVDDLSVKSVKDATDLIVLLSNKRKHSENLLVILIFQAGTATDRNTIHRKLQKTYLKIDFVSFQPLGEETVEKCFRFEIQRQGVMILNTELRKMVEEKMKHVDVLNGPPGCKGVDADVASYFRKKFQ